ncbi:T9SS type A sorting domain-containing protein [Flavicella sediminum]|uniref:T9SS type A sorting domain-containing protein n=1 Tax=Flavicella sediminum TaxID=2585141 RepID=UPI001408D436|nr:T9SS type A sorting domain-containing protein [Flavicella sediminum]
MNKNYLKTIFRKSSVLFLFLGITSYAQNNTVTIDIACQRFLNEVSELDRTKYFSVHDSGTDKEQAAFRKDYNVTGGRSFWGAFSFAKSKTGSVGVYPASKNGNNNPKEVNRGQISTEHPSSAFVDGMDVEKAANWAVEYFKDFQTDAGRPEYVEVMNEPFVHASDFYDGWNAAENNRIKKQMALFYKEVGKKIQEDALLNKIKVIGYSSAWPSVELYDFGHWEENMKMFMDTAGEHMYGFATHLYDGVNVEGQDNKRSGSNSEAILDLIENYSMMKWGVVKPHAISEYGAIEKGYGDAYSDIASAQTTISINHILFNLLDREDRLTCSIPFITGKATWHINEANNYQPYQAVLWKPTNIGEPTPAGWEYTPRINFYKLWKDVKGKRVFIKSDNPDIQSHAFVDGNKMHIALSNLDEVSQTVDLKMLTSLTDLINVKVKSLKVYVDALASYTETVVDDLTSLELIKDETVVIEFNLKNGLAFDNALRTKLYYPANNLEKIEANKEITYSFNNVATGDGFAKLRMSIGRKHDVTKQPLVKVNGVEVQVPVNYPGYDQANRDDYFGMIEIPFPASLLNESNNVSVVFPDTGGKISSMILSTDIYDKAQNSFSLQSIGNPCPGEMKGELKIKPLISDSYRARLTGENFDETYQFSSNYSIQNLASGKYQLVVTSDTDVNFKSEFILVIQEPESLTVASKINEEDKIMVLNLTGGSSYSIRHNKETIHTANSEYILELKNGANQIEVKTDADCQGLFLENVAIGEEIHVYPNPFKEAITIDLGIDKSEFAKVDLFSSTGNLVFTSKKKVEEGKINLVTSFMKSGVYVVAVQTAAKVVFRQMIK